MSQQPHEEELAKALLESGTEESDIGETALRRLPAKTEIRIQMQIDPIVQETQLYRRMAKEVDRRYDRYVRESTSAEKPDEPK